MALRTEAKIGQARLARLVGCSKQTMSDIERGRWGTTLKRATRIAEVLCVPVEELLLTEEDADRPAA